MFFCRRIEVFLICFCAKSQNGVYLNFFVDKSAGLCLNRHNRISNDSDGKFAFTECFREPAAGASRCGRFWRSDS